MNKAAAKYGLDPQMIKAIMKTESDFNKETVSHAGARGLMQVMPVVWQDIEKKYGLGWDYSTEVFDPAKNIFAVQFKNIDTSHMQMLRLMALPSGEMNNSEQVTQVLSGTEPEEVLVTNESIPSFNRPAYKTVRGILHFKEIPW